MLERGTPNCSQLRFETRIPRRDAKAQFGVGFALVWRRERYLRAPERKP
jgi:hypothetical protein